MKRITITYHMEKQGDMAENCITIPASDETLQAIFGAGPDAHTRLSIDQLINALAELAGYAITAIISVLKCPLTSLTTGRNKPCSSASPKLKPGRC